MDLTQKIASCLPLVAMASGCYAEADLYVPETKNDDCIICTSLPVLERDPMVITKPGTYKVVEGDVFKGKLGTNLRIDEIIVNDNEFKGSYIKSKENSEDDEETEFSELFAEHKIPIAFFGIKVLTGEKPGTLTLTDNVYDIYQRCQELQSYFGYKDIECSEYSPTEAFSWETLVESPKGYFGKVDPGEVDQIYYPEKLAKKLAECAETNAMDLEHAVEETSKFLGKDPLSKGASNLLIITKSEPESPSISHGNIAILRLAATDIESIDTVTSSCQEKKDNNNYLPSMHEVNHILLKKYSSLMPSYFMEGLCDYIPDKLSGKSIPWSWVGSKCQKEGFIMGWATEPIPYVKYDDLTNPYVNYSAPCFWSKLVKLYGDEIIKTLIKQFDKMVALGDISSGKSEEEAKEKFVKALNAIGVDDKEFNEFGLGK